MSILGNILEIAVFTFGAFIFNDYFARANGIRKIAFGLAIATNVIFIISSLHNLFKLTAD